MLCSGSSRSSVLHSGSTAFDETAALAPSFQCQLRCTHELQSNILRDWLVPAKFSEVMVAFGSMLTTMVCV
jgi:hypothetical protein